ncbi:hypothetical protein BE221DRAFT_76760 [Ostreococcus tauri]|uniref:WW domain-containing protein n=1 Tax=Ostreococcus tauri TaxID=70448 RepID=A0A1Y5I9T6_OSTTA|nr:hypothetical protein BE221DRAFT_76760 [Ostreococcus tauri]
MRRNVRSLARSLALAREGTMRAHAHAHGHGARAYGARRPPPPANVSRESACWEAVTDARTGKTYWWNVETDETTDVDAARPKTYSVVDPTMPAPMASDRAPPPARYERDGVGGIAGGLGSMMAQGAAWGMGSAASWTTTRWTMDTATAVDRCSISFPRTSETSARFYQSRMRARAAM